MSSTPVLLDDDARAAADVLIRLALEEDLAGIGDLTCEALVDERPGTIDVVAREEGVLAGGAVAELVFAALDGRVVWDRTVLDGTPFAAGTVLATVHGPVRSLLVGERTALNLLGHLCGVATLTARFVERTAGTKATVLDTRKTLPGYRRLHKYAVRCGGGTNHRMGLYDGVLIKDNHLAACDGESVAAAVRRARAASPDVPIEVEVDSLDQFRDALSGEPDIVLLDNFTLDDLRAAVATRDERAPDLLLEASGGVTLDTVADIARTGVDRISVGALTHSATNLDVGFDWSRATT